MYGTQGSRYVPDELDKFIKSIDRNKWSHSFVDPAMGTSHYKLNLLAWQIVCYRINTDVTLSSMIITLRKSPFIFIFTATVDWWRQKCIIFVLIMITKMTLFFILKANWWDNVKRIKDMIFVVQWNGNTRSSFGWINPYLTSA